MIQIRDRLTSRLKGCHGPTALFVPALVLVWPCSQGKGKRCVLFSWVSPCTRIPQLDLGQNGSKGMGAPALLPQFGK